MNNLSFLVGLAIIAGVIPSIICNILHRDYIQLKYTLLISVGTILVVIKFL